MTSAETVSQLKAKFGYAFLSETTAFGETTFEVKKEHLKEVLAILKEPSELGYEVLMDLTAVDYLIPDKRTKVVYWLHNPQTLSRVRIVLFVNREERIPSVCDLWEGANWYERELYDLFGVQFEGHPDLKRILMPDDWKGHPLLKDYALTEESVEFKHDVKPKIPSEIIPRTKKQNRFNQFGSYVKGD